MKKRPGQKENKSSVFCQRIFLTTETVTFHIINLLLFFQEKLVTSMSREDIDLVANSEDAVSINFFFKFSMVFKMIKSIVLKYNKLRNNFHANILFLLYSSASFAANQEQLCRCLHVDINRCVDFVLCIIFVKQLLIETYHFVASFVMQKLQE